MLGNKALAALSLAGGRENCFSSETEPRLSLRSSLVHQTHLCSAVDIKSGKEKFVKAELHSKIQPPNGSFDLQTLTPGVFLCTESPETSQLLTVLPTNLHTKEWTVPEVWLGLLQNPSALPRTHSQGPLLSQGSSLSTVF